MTSPPKSAAWMRRKQHWLRTRSQLSRLEQGIASARPRILARQDSSEAARLNSSRSDEIEQQTALSLATSLLEGANAALMSGLPDSGWAQLHAALEAEVAAYEDAEVEALRVSLRAEVSSGYLGGWHARAVEDLLVQLEAPKCHAGTPCGPDCPPPDRLFAANARGILRHALQLRNEFFENLYISVRVSSHRRILLLLIGVMLLAGAAWLIWKRPSSVTLDDNEGFVAACAAVAGMLGATTSAIQRLAANPTATIPAELDSLTATLTRPFIGAVGALTTFFAYQSGLLQLSTDAPVAFLLLASFGIGFTERLVVYNPQQAPK